jgi:hypothetical protein
MFSLRSLSILSSVLGRNLDIISERQNKIYVKNLIKSLSRINIKQINSISILITYCIHHV